MNQYNPETHHRRSVRLHGYDYSWQGLYFVTICVHEQRKLLGEVVDGEIVLDTCGRIACKHWFLITSQFTNTFLHKFVIMPNHIHGIIELTDVGARFITPKMNTAFSCQGAINLNAPNKGAINRSPTGGFTGEMNPMLHMNLARIIRWYKGRTTFECRKKEPGFSWQSNYYEHIIRYEDDYNRIIEYMTNNPVNWNNDSLYRG